MRAPATLKRFFHIIYVAIRHAAAHVIHSRLAGRPALARKFAGPRRTGPERVRVAFEEIGGTFIKFGQMLAMQSDLLPLEYCQGLFSLFDQVAPFAYEDVERTFLEDLRRKPSEIFTSFELHPIATGSIGQVHVAMLGTQKVAVKIRRPTILSDFGADVAAMTFVVNVVKFLRLRGLYWIIAPTEEFVAWTREEMDYRREAHYMEELGRNARNSITEKVPAVFWSCTTARILTAEFLEGTTISEYFRNRKANHDMPIPDFKPNVFAGRLINNFLGDAFRHGMFHADLHPGNLVILPGNVVGYIDFGISGVLSRYSRRHLISMTLSYARGDLDTMCESFFRISTFDRNVDLPRFRQRLREVSSEWYGSRDGESRLRKSITSIMLELLVLSRECGVWPQRDVIKYIRSAIALDGLIKTFSPETDIGRHLEQACEQHLKWDSFKNLVSTDVMVGWLGGNAHLVRDGVLRTFSLLSRLRTEKPTIPKFNPKHEPARSVWREVLYLAWIALCVGIILQRSQLEFARHISLFAIILLVGISGIVWRAMKYARVI